MNAGHRRGLSSLLLAGAMAVAPHALQLPLWVIAIFAAGALWRYLGERRAWPRPGRLGRIGLMLLILVAVFRQYHTLLGREPGLALLIALLGLKFLEARTARDDIVCLFLFYLVILGSFLYRQTLWLGAWALLAVTAGLAALIHVTQTGGLGFAARLRLAGLILVKALPLMTIVYLLFPRIGGALWGLPTDAYSGLTGMPETIQPGSIRSLSESSEIALRVVFDGAPPPLRELYWRGLVLEQTDGHSWSRLASPSIGQMAFTATAAPRRYQVILEPNNKPWMPLLGLPREAPPGARLKSDLTLVHEGPIRERLYYTLSVYLHYQTAEPGTAVRARNLQLPPRLSPRVRALAEAWRRRSHDPLQLAEMALDYFRHEHFVYTLHPPLLGEDPVDQFLFDSRRGFCEHFASAFVTLMRAAGVPSRVVVGYLGGELNPSGDYLIVRQSDAHAWAEIRVSGRGWVRVDPTAAVAPERIELGSEAVRRLEEQGVALGSLSADAVLRAVRLDWLARAVHTVRGYWDLSDLIWYRWVVDYGKDRQEQFLSALGLMDLSWSRLLGLAFSGALLPVMLYGLWWLRPRSNTDPALVLYRRFCRKLARAGVVRAPHEGPHAFAERAARRRADLAESIREITTLYETLRYGPGAPDRSSIARLKQRVAALRA
jgi:transglutaminase-like putative cysteine protease